MINIIELLKLREISGSKLRSLLYNISSYQRDQVYRANTFTFTFRHLRNSI